MKLEMVEPTEKDEEYIVSLFPVVKRIKDESIRRKVVQAWMVLLHNSKWKRIEDIGYLAPWNSSLNKEVWEKEKFVPHTNLVAAIALDIAKYGKSEFGMEINEDHLIAATILHDSSYLLEFEGPEYKPGPPTLVKEYFAHSEYGAFVAQMVGLPLEVAHAIRSHTIHSTTEPKTMEARLVRYGDFVAHELLCSAYGLGTFLLSNAELADKTFNTFAAGLYKPRPEDVKK